jgi:hypothetical protein
MVLDIGGGTTDIAVHAYGEKATSVGATMKEVVQGSGGLCGGSHIDQQFIGLMNTKIPGFSEAFLRQQPNAFASFLSNWDKIKRQFRGTETMLSVSIPNKLQSYMNTEEDELTLSSAELKQIFNPIVDNIISIVMKQRQKVIEVTKKAPRLLTLVGGLSESPYIRARLQEQLSGSFEKLFTPPNPGSAVAKGATVYGLDPKIFIQRIARRTYALELSRKAIAGDRGDMQFVRPDNGETWTTYLHTWVKAGQEVPGDFFINQDIYPLYHTQTELSYVVYSAEAPDIGFRSEPGVELDLEVTLNMPLVC